MERGHVATRPLILHLAAEDASLHRGRQRVEAADLLELASACVIHIMRVEHTVRVKALHVRAILPRVRREAGHREKARGAKDEKKSVRKAGARGGAANASAQARPSTWRAPDQSVLAAMPRCHYEVLEVERDAQDDELKKAYRKLALKVRGCRRKKSTRARMLTLMRVWRCVRTAVAPR